MKLVGDKYFGGSTDVWIGNKRKIFISFSIHFVDGPILRTIDLACERFYGLQTGAFIAKKLETVLVDKGLDPKKCAGITIDNAPNMIKAGEILGAADNSICTVPCFCHSLQLTVHRFQGIANVNGRPQTTGAPGAGGAGSEPPSGYSSRVKSALSRCNDIITSFKKSPKVSVVCSFHVSAVQKIMLLLIIMRRTSPTQPCLCLYNFVVRRASFWCRTAHNFPGTIELKNTCRFLVWFARLPVANRECHGSFQFLCCSSSLFLPPFSEHRAAEGERRLAWSGILRATGAHAHAVVVGRDKHPQPLEE